MIWSEMLGSVSELNLLLSRPSCTSVALLEKIQLCKLDLLDSAPAAVSLLIPSDLEDDKTRNLILALCGIGCGVVLRCMTIWSCAQQPNLEMAICW
jgi:hypothetical protein